MEAVALVLIGLGLGALVTYVVTSKWLMQGHRNALRESEVNCFTYLVCAPVLVFWFFSPFNVLLNTHIPDSPNATIFWGAVVFAIIVNGLIQFSFNRSYKLADASKVVPIQALTPGILVFVALTLNEYPGLLAICGIVLVSVGTYVHLREGEPLKEYFRPLYVWRLFLKERHTALFSEEEYQKKENERLGLIWAYVGAILGTFGLVSTAIVARHGDVALYGAVETAVLAIVFVSLYPRFLKNEKAKEIQKKVEILPLKNRLRVFWKQILLLGVAYAFHIVFIIIAFRVAPVANVGSIKRIYIFFVALAAVWVLRETKMAPRRITLASIIVVGAILIALDPTQAVVADSVNDYLTFLRK